MGGASSFYAMLAIAGFLTSIWLASRLSRTIGISSIVLEVGLGLLLGPSVGKLIPYELSTCGYQQVTDCSTEKSQRKIADEDTEYCDLGAYLEKNKYVKDNKHWTTGFFGNVTSVKLGDHHYHLNGSHDHRRLAGGGNAGKTEYDTYGECLEEQCGYKLAIKCAETPDIFSLLGHTGVAMMIFESGMHFDFEQAKTVGPWACAVAVLGTFLPIIAGTGVAMAFGYPLFPDGLAVGVSLAPTSVGIALKLLHEAKALQTYFGQAVMTAAFVDDVLSLILFSVLFAMRGEMTFMTFLPLVLGCIFMVIAIVAAVVVWPPIIRWIFRMIPETKPNHKLTRHDEVWWLLMFAVFTAYAMITHLCGTHLWGCFIAGMSFSTFHHAHHVWVRQVKRITCWLLRIFFSCTLAWSIPVGDLFEWEAIWKGTLMGIGPCILTKVLCAPFMGSPRWVIGWAMVGRAEFAYFIAIMAKSLRMMEDKLFAILIWALIYATIFAPLIFRKVLRRYMAAQEAEAGGTDEKASVRTFSQQHPARLSGHLPDLEQDENDEKAAKETLRVSGMEGELAEMKKAVAEMKLQKETAEAELEKLKNQETLEFQHKCV